MSDLSIQIQTLGGTNHTFTDEFIKSCRWSYERFGGCGQCNITMDMPPENTAPAITGCQNVQVSVGGNLVYQGRVDRVDVSQQSANDPRLLQLAIDGYGRAMEGLTLTAEYTNETVESIVTNIMNSVVIGNSSVGFTTADVYTTGFTIDKISFNENCWEAMRKLAEIVGGVEYGVDRNRAFYFKQKTTTNQNFNFATDNDMYNFSYTEDYNAIKNVIHLAGGILTTTGNQVGNGQMYEETYSNVASQALYGRREVVYDNGVITTTTVGSQWASNMFTIIGVPKKTASFNHDRLATCFEITATPLRMITAQGVGIDGTSFDVTSINYTWDITASSGVNAAFTLGQYRNYNPNVRQGKGQGVPVRVPAGVRQPDRNHQQPAIISMTDPLVYVDGLNWGFPATFSNGAITKVSMTGVKTIIKNATADCVTNNCVIDRANNRVQFPYNQFGASNKGEMTWQSTR